DALVESDPAGEPLPPEAAIGGEDETLGRKVLERLPDQVGHDLGRLDRGARVAHHAERDLFVRPVLPEEREVLAAGRRALERDDVGVGLEQMRERALVGWALPVERLLVRDAPAGVQPQLRLYALDLTAEGVDTQLRFAACWGNPKQQ